MSLLLSIIIPTLREREILESLQKMRGFLDQIYADRYEWILVDDSEDLFYSDLVRQSGQIEALKGRLKLIRGDGMGKGAAIKKGVFSALGEVIFYMDADFPIPWDQVPVFLDQISNDGYDVAIAERPFKRNWMKPFRYFLSFGLLMAQRLLVFQSFCFHDTQCGFKAFKGSVLKAIAEKQRVNGGMFDIEYLYISKLNRLRIHQSRLQPRADGRLTTIRLWKCFFFDPKDLFLVKLRGLLGLYRLQ